MEKIIYILMVFSIFTSGCLTSTAMKAKSIKVDESKVLIGWQTQNSIPVDAYYVLVEKRGKWTVIDVVTAPLRTRDNNNQEILYIDKQLRYVQPYFQSYPNTVVNLKDGRTGEGLTIKRGTFECSPLMDDKKLYTPCTSNLTSADLLKSAGKNVFSVFSLGLAAGSHKYVDSEKVRKVLDDTNILTLLKENPNIAKAGLKEKLKRAENGAELLDELRQKVQAIREKKEEGK